MFFSSHELDHTWASTWIRGGGEIFWDLGGGIQRVALSRGESEILTNLTVGSCENGIGDSIPILILGNHRFQNFWKGIHVKMESEENQRFSSDSNFLKTFQIDISHFL